MIDNNINFNEKFNNYFDYFWPLFLELNKDIKSNTNYFETFKKQVRKCIRKTIKANPSLLEEEQTYHTFKLPHTSSLIKWRRKLKGFLRKYFESNPHLKHHKLVILREFHKCHLDCHHIGTGKDKKHKDKGCDCNVKHPCKKDIHIVIITSTELDFSYWKTIYSNYHYHKVIVDPKKLCITNLDNGDTKELRHPITGEIVNEMDKVISYANKQAEGRHKDPELYKRHDDNPNNDYFDTFNYLTDLNWRNYKSDYNKRYFKENKENVKEYISNNPIYQSLNRKIKYLDKKINKASTNEKKKALRIERNKLVFELNNWKENFVKNEHLIAKKTDPLIDIYKYISYYFFNFTPLYYVRIYDNSTIKEIQLKEVFEIENVSLTNETIINKIPIVETLKISNDSISSIEELNKKLFKFGAKRWSDKSLLKKQWPCCWDCYKDNLKHCSVKCLMFKKYLLTTKEDNLSPCQHFIMDENRKVISFDNDCNCKEIISNINLDKVNFPTKQVLWFT